MPWLNLYIIYVVALYINTVIKSNITKNHYCWPSNSILLFEKNICISAPQSNNYLCVTWLPCQDLPSSVTQLTLFLSYPPIPDILGTSHNLSWRRGEGEEKLGGLQFFFGWNMGGLKMPKDDLGRVFKFLLSSIPTEQQDA